MTIVLMVSGGGLEPPINLKQFYYNDNDKFGSIFNLCIYYNIKILFCKQLF